MINIKSNIYISALYFLMLNGGYDYYKFKKDKDILNSIESFRVIKNEYKKIVEKLEITDGRPNSFWPNLFIAECLMFNLDSNGKIISMENFLDYIKNRNNIDFKDISLFEIESNSINIQNIISKIIKTEEFKEYYKFAGEFITQTIEKNKLALIDVTNIIESINNEFGTKFESVNIILDPIKCIYSADPYYEENTINIILGEFNKLSIYHEFVHIIVEKFLMVENFEFDNKEEFYSLEEKYVRSISNRIIQSNKVPTYDDLKELRDTIK